MARSGSGRVPGGPVRSRPGPARTVLPGPSLLPRPRRRARERSRRAATRAGRPAPTAAADPAVPGGPARSAAPNRGPGRFPAVALGPPEGHGQAGRAPVAAGAGEHLGLLGIGRGAVPHPGVDPYLILLRQWREAAPRTRFANVAKLRNKQLRQPLVFQHGPRCEPGQNAGRKDVEPEQIVIEGQPNGYEDGNVRNRDTTENGDPADGQRHRQAEIIKLVEPLLNSPDVRICGQVHEVRSFGRDGVFRRYGG